MFPLNLVPISKCPLICLTYLNSGARNLYKKVFSASGLYVIVKTLNNIERIHI